MTVGCVLLCECGALSGQKVILKSLSIRPVNKFRVPRIQDIHI